LVVVSIMVLLRGSNILNVKKILGLWLNSKKYNLATNLRLLFLKDILELNNSILLKIFTKV